MKKKPLVERAFEAGRKAALKSNPNAHLFTWNGLSEHSKAGFKAIVKYIKAHPNDK